MLIEFRIRNYRSYAEEQRFSMVARLAKDLTSNVLTTEGVEHFSLLRGAAIYGANASGKSNLIKALIFLRRFVLRSPEMRDEESEARQKTSEIPVQPFLLDLQFSDQPSEFEITFLLDGVRHQYGFAASSKRVHEEWLYVYPKGRSQRWFHRVVDENGVSTFDPGRPYFQRDKQLEKRTRDDALFLSVAAQWNHPQINPIYQWFRSRLKAVGQGLSATTYTGRLLLNNPRFREWAGDSLRKADTGINHVFAKESSVAKENLRFPNDMPPEMKDYLVESLLKAPMVEIYTTRTRPGTEPDLVWDLAQESDGTQRMLELLGPIYDVLQKGAVFIMDELDTSLHPYITREFVRLFNDPEANPKGAQLIFTTHDISLLDPTFLRRDQIWLTEKKASGHTELYSLADFSPRKGEAILKGYLSGRYGAVPDLEAFETISNSGGLIQADMQPLKG